MKLAKTKAKATPKKPKKEPASFSSMGGKADIIINIFLCLGFVLSINLKIYFIFFN